DGDSRSSYVILDDEDNSIEFRRIKYDVSLTSQKIYDISDLDKFLGDRLHDGK
ncbi:MAG: metallophosphoesterase, partial [Planctomycetaceae bacterium]|nr:metallophosphoesterase [Planctomycetaceae bacterium]